MKKIVAIVGRPNVGKSTLFNRLTKSRQAIVDEYSGVTRDRQYGTCEWEGVEFTVIDTGGYVENSDDIFEKEIKKQVLLAINESNIILFMVDVITGITDLDLSVSRIIKKSNKKSYLLVNKVENTERMLDATEFYKLGFEEVFFISSINGSGTGELLDNIVENIRANSEDIEEIEKEELPKFAIIGRPNVGKSMLLNTLIGEERNIVTPISGTTRDSIHTRYSKYGFDFWLIDTAGIRKKSKISENLEFYSVMRSIKAIEQSDVCILLIDATTGIESQDMNIFYLVEKNHKGIVIVVNKWDLINKNEINTEEYTKVIKQRIAPFNDVPIIFASALTKQRIMKILQTTMEVYKNRLQKIPTSKLNETMREIIDNYPPPIVKNKEVKIKYVTQLPSHAPAFAFFCNFPQYIKDPYKRYLENKIREKYNFTGVPLRLFFRKK
jgi:GTP-binding protein